MQKNITLNARDGSALSKGTLDSGVGLEDAGAGSHIPGTVAETVFSPRRAIGLNKGKFFKACLLFLSFYMGLFYA